MNKDNTKAYLGDVLRKIDIELHEGINIPLLSRKTNQIIINCNDGNITDIKPIFKITK